MIIMVDICELLRTIVGFAYVFIKEVRKKDIPLFLKKFLMGII